MDLNAASEATEQPAVCVIVWFHTHHDKHWGGGAVMEGMHWLHWAGIFFPCPCPLIYPIALVTVLSQVNGGQGIIESWSGLC